MILASDRNHNIKRPPVVPRNISKSQRSVGTVCDQSNIFSNLGIGVPLERGFWN